MTDRTADTPRPVKPAAQDAKARTGREAPRVGFFTGRGELVLALIAFGLAAVLGFGIVTMKVAGSSTPGPTFFPLIIVGLLLVIGVLLVIKVLRQPRESLTHAHSLVSADVSADLLKDVGDVSTRAIMLPETVDGRPVTSDTGTLSVQRTYRTYTDWRTVGIILGALVLFALLLNPLGWILSGAMLFYAVAYALGSKRHIFDIFLSLLMSSAVYIAFAIGLGLNLPAGFIGGLV